jgi:subtilase family serine protease
VNTALLVSGFLAGSLTFLAGATPGGTGTPQFVPLAMERVPALERATDVGPAQASRTLYLSVSMPYARPVEIQRFVDSVSDPKSPSYGKFITPEEVGERFGLPQTEVDRVADYLRGHGMTVTFVSKNRLSVSAEATVAQAEAAFHTTIREYTLVPQNEVEPERFIANATVPELPGDLAGIVIDVSGLETYTRPRHLSTLTPALTRGLYHTDSLFTAGVQGQGRTVAVSNFTGFRISNAVDYVQHFGLPTPVGGAATNISVITISGGSGSGPDDAEGDLDMQMEIGMAPLANILIYDGGGNDLIGVLSREVSDNSADVVSESYGWSLSNSIANSAHNYHVSMSAQGITYCAASGDSGTSIGSFGYPCDDPDVLDVGGTVATVQNGTGARTSEVGWSGSGGGWSTQTPSFNLRPAYQQGNGVPASPNKRLIPDVGFHASSGGGAYQFYVNGGLSGGYVGTSFASPIVAGLLAIAEQRMINNGALPPNGQGKQRLGRVADLIYSMNGRSDVWFDVTSGSNGTLPDGTASSAHAGWDYVTGWGPFDTQAFADVATCLTGHCGPGTAFCVGDSQDPNVTTFCPCLNFGSAGNGCSNSANVAGAQLSATGSAQTDTVVFTSSGELSSALSILMQGNSNASAGVVAGDGIRCVAGTLKRLYAHSASGGSVTFPSGSDPSVRTQSSIKGDNIPSGGTRYYQVYYRDANASFCTSATFNLSNGYIVVWP